MSDGYKIRDQTLPHFVTATVVDWVDVFTRKIMNIEFYKFGALERHTVMGAKSKTFAKHPKNNDISYHEHFGELGKTPNYDCQESRNYQNPATVNAHTWQTNYNKKYRKENPNYKP